MKTEHHVITLKTRNPPVVELDSAAMAAYVRFSRRKVARTDVLDSRKSTVTVDFDSAGEVIGIELKPAPHKTKDETEEKALSDEDPFRGVQLSQHDAKEHRQILQ